MKTSCYDPVHRVVQSHWNFFFDSDDEAAALENEHVLGDHDAPVDENMFLMDKSKNFTSAFSKNVLIKILLLLDGKLRHNLTYAAAEDFAKLVDIKAKEYVGHTSKYHTRNIVNSFTIPTQIHHFCPSCHLYAGQEQKSMNEKSLEQTLECKECNHSIDVLQNHQSGNIFMHLSLTEQLKHFFEKNHTDSLYSNSRKKQVPYNIQNIFDTETYNQCYQITSPPTQLVLILVLMVLHCLKAHKLP